MKKSIVVQKNAEVAVSRVQKNFRESRIKTGVKGGVHSPRHVRDLGGTPCSHRLEHDPPLSLSLRPGLVLYTSLFPQPPPCGREWWWWWW